MKLAIMQPYFFPYIGYFQLIHAADHFLIFDDVQYIERGWIHRNRILLGGEPTYINLPIKKAPRDTLIMHREIATHEMPRFKDKLAGQLRAAYKNASHYQTIIELVDAALDCRETTVAAFLRHTINVACEYLGIKTTMGFSSSVPIDDAQAKAQDRIISLCKKMHADSYINSIGGQALYKAHDFTQQGIELHFIKTNPIIYEQAAPVFVPNLSIIDVMMFNTPVQIKTMLDHYELV